MLEKNEARDKEGDKNVTMGVIAIKIGRERGRKGMKEMMKVIGSKRGKKKGRYEKVGIMRQKKYRKTMRGRTNKGGRK